jgi:hypothetical protein
VNAFTKTSRMLGVAFIIQFVTPFSSGAFLKPALITPGDIGASMIRIAQHPALMGRSQEMGEQLILDDCGLHGQLCE